MSKAGPIDPRSPLHASAYPDDAGDVDRLMTAADVAAMIGMSPSWVYSAVEQRRMPHVRFGAAIRFRRSSIEQWVADLEHRPTGEGSW